MQEYISSKQTEGYEKIGEDLLVLGSSQMDVYTGYLKVSEITAEVELYMVTTGISDISGFRQYLRDHDDYTYAILSDGSGWILRETETDWPFAHIHPARHSKFSRRVKAGILKTSIAVSVLLPGNKEPRSAEVNKIRQEVLSLPPLRTVDHTALKDLLNWLDPGER